MTAAGSAASSTAQDPAIRPNLKGTNSGTLSCIRSKHQRHSSRGRSRGRPGCHRAPVTGQNLARRTRIAIGNSDYRDWATHRYLLPQGWESDHRISPIRREVWRFQPRNPRPSRSRRDSSHRTGRLLQNAMAALGRRQRLRASNNPRCAVLLAADLFHDVIPPCRPLRDVHIGETRHLALRRLIVGDFFEAIEVIRKEHRVEPVGA